MKDRWITWQTGVLFLLALTLIIGGMTEAGNTFSEFEAIALNHQNHEELLLFVRATAVSTMILGSMVAAGIGILVILFLHTIRRSTRLQKEAALLRRKNEAMEELNRKTQQLAHHQRLETIGTLTSSIAHEFNNLLTPIMGYSMLTLEKLPPEEEELYDNVLEIYEASRKAKNIISRLNDLSRKNNAMTFREVSLDETVKRTLDVVRPAKPRKVQVRLDLNCWDQRIQANEIQLSQMLLNLILNGFHAIGDLPGELTITTNFSEHDVFVRIEDTGCGIPEEILPRIFEPFFTTKETGKGTGLGLAIAAQVVEDHSGSIQVDSRVGQGTAITVRLPRQ